MIEFYEYWSALFRAPLVIWTVATQLMAVVIVLATHFIAWKARRYAMICVFLGTLSLILISIPLFILGWGLGGWDNWDKSPPPEFVDLTWLYFGGLETGLLLLALGTAFLHRKQFSLPLLNGFCGFFFDAALNAFFLSYWGNTFISSRLAYLGSPQSRILAFYALSGFLLWLLFAWMRPTMLLALKSLRLTRHPKTQRFD